MRKRFIHALLALGLVSGLLAGAVGTASGDQHGAFADHSSAIFFPTVHDGATVDGTGPWHTNITVQNLEESRLFIEFSSYVGGPVHATTTLQPYASNTFRASQVNGGVTTGPVVATAYWAPQAFDDDGNPVFAPCTVEDTEISDPQTGTANLTKGSFNTADTFNLPEGQTLVSSEAETEVTVAGETYTEGAGVAGQYEYSQTTTSFSLDWGTLLPGSQPGTGVGYEVEYTYTEEIAIDAGCDREPAVAGYAKQSANEQMTADSRTSASHLSVDGYTASPVADVAWGPQTEFSNLGLSILGIPLGAFIGAQWDGHSYLPIVQSNDGWNTVINLSHIDGSPGSSNAAATVRVYEAFGQGLGGESAGTTVQLSPGDTVSINLTDDLGLPEGFVGSVWIAADYGIISNAERVKSETNMLVVNESAPSLFDFTVEAGEEGPIGGIGTLLEYEAYAPLVFSGYNGWNSGFSVVNIAEIENTVNIAIHGPTGNVVHSEVLTIPAKGQKYVYMPHTDDLGLEPGFHGAAVFSALLPFHASVDQVKYSTGEAMSYIATQAGANIGLINEVGDTPFSKLGFPLVQKGNAETGMGDTSGLQLFNGTITDWANVRVHFFDSAGNFAPPTASDALGIPVDLGPKETGTVYTLNYHQMTTGIPHSAIATVWDGAADVYGVTNNVNYAVQGDGAVAWNAVNAYGQFRTWSGPFFGFDDDEGEPEL